MNKLRDTDYSWLGSAPIARIGDIIVFIIGGVTYGEMKAIHSWNTSNTGNKVTVGGTSVISTHMFLESIVQNSS